MVNKELLFSAVYNKINRLALHSIVNECFINGLPISNDVITKQETIGLTKYSYDVLNRLGGFSVLESAMINEALSFDQKLLLGSIYNICTEASKEVATRIVKETDCKAPTTKMNDVVDKASMTKDEYQKFISSARTLDVDKISDIIKEKTLAVIKDEQEQYEKEDQLDQELKDALSESKDFSSTTVESYMDIVLSKQDPRHHVSVFSKLQDSAMEMMSIVKVGNNGTDPIPVINKVTFEGFIEELKCQNEDFDVWYESYNGISNEEVCEVPDNVKPKLGTLVSIIIYTIMETLKTMNLYTPAMSEIKKFVNKQVTTGDDVVKLDKGRLYEKAQEKVSESNMTDFSKVNSKDLSKKLNDLKKVSELVQESARVNGDSEITVPLVYALESQIEDITDVLNVRDADNKAKAAVVEGYYENLNRSRDIAQMNKISNLFGKNPNVKEIRLKVDPNRISSVIDVECANESMQVIKSSFINIEYACESNVYLDYIASVYNNSKLATVDKPVYLVVNDGTGRKIEL